MATKNSGPLGRASLEHQRGVRAAGYLGTCLAAWAIGCGSDSTTAVPGGETGQGGSSAVATSHPKSGPSTNPIGPSTGGASQTATTGRPPASGGAPVTSGKQTVATGGSQVNPGTLPQAGGMGNVPSGGSNANPGGSTGTGTGTSSPGAPKPSQGCGVKDGAKTLTTGGTPIANGLPTSTRLKITSGGSAREYIIDIPADYDPSHPYRLIFSWHQAYGSDTGNAIGQRPTETDGPNFNAENYAYFGLRREANKAKQPAIFVAPGGIGNYPWEFARDSALFDELLALVSKNLCIDESRVFATGFSFGAMMSYSLSITRQTKLRAVVTMAAANYNLPQQPTDSNEAPIAYLGFTGMDDQMCPWIDGNSTTRGGKYCVLTHASDNNCKIPAEIPTEKRGSKKYSCHDFEGCKAGYPVKVCTFDGAHTPSSVNDGTTNGEDGLKAFIPPLAWEFISQF